MPHKKHIAELAHQSPGRVRIRVRAAKGDPQTLEEIRKELSSLACVHEVKVNESLGTITIHYDHTQHDQLHRHLAGEDPHQKVLCSCPNLSDLSQIDNMITKEAEFLSSHSRTAEALFQFSRRVDEGVKRATGNAIDLKVLAPLALAVGVFIELGATAATPVWLTLGLFSFNHFVELHSHSGNGDSVPLSDGQRNPQAGSKPLRFP